MYDKLNDSVQEMEILFPFQYGFQQGHFTAMSLINLQDKISNASDNNEYSIGIFLVLAKSFDTVDHKIFF